MPLSDIKMVTPKDLVNDPHLLLHKRGPEDTRTVFDGKVGAVVTDGQYFVVSPNMDHVYTPPLGNKREMRLRADGRYADNDYLVGPQPYSVPFCHYAAVPRKPKDPFDALAIMWWIPTRDDFDFVDGGNILAGLGRLDPIKLGRLGGLVHSIQQQVQEYKNNRNLSHGKNSPITALSTALNHAFTRLASLSTSLRQTQFGVALLQRSFLELKAHLDYLTVFHPRMTGEQPAATSVADMIGAYVFDEVVVQEFVRAGLPVWTLKQCSLLSTTRVDSLVQPRLPTTWAVLEDAIPQYQPFFTGSAVEPSALSSSSTDSIPSSGPIRTTAMSSSSQTCHTESKKQKKYGQPYPKNKPSQHGVAPIMGRNKFIEPSSSLYPPPIPAWSEALALVDRDRRNLKSGSRPVDAGYIFLDPGLFIGVSDSAKVPKFLHTWLKYREALLFRVSLGKGTAGPISAQLWRTLLNYGGEVGQGLGMNNERRQQVAGILGDCLAEKGLQLTSTVTTSWRQQQLPPDVLPPQNITQEILWELFELNFRFEFVGLDSRCNNTKDTFERQQQLIMACFPGRHGGSLLVVDVGAGDRGLAAVSWKDRAHYLLAMLKVIRSWSECPSSLVDGAEKGVEELSESVVLAMEEGLARFYTQSFFNHFARAAIVPRRLIYIDL
ncbi:hypothetical protein Hypma_005260 [Hypsizygus marmoreus]|uniref:Uncharacterized protein n=1 Tax=Hypsizygus marmoreus TaxID=39966 RepID=A0A369JY70_HYPMA|nr:hypothetical protein Hypma_005260 [Hypsizygus marmoreus]